MGFLRYTIFTLLLTMAFGSSALAQGPITFNIGSGSGQSGDTVCVDVTVEGFENVASLEWFHRWDFNIIGLDTVFVANSCLNADGMGLLPISSFNLNEATTKFGKLTWFDSGATGVSIDDGCVLYTICFELIGDPCETSVVDITGGDNQIGVEITIDDENTIELPVSDIIVNPGTITIDPAGFVISESHCSSDDAGNTGSIMFAGAGGTGPYSWTVSLTGTGLIQSSLPGEEINDCETAMVNDLAPGTYTITFTDVNGAIIDEIITIMANSDFPFILTLDPSDPSCFDKNNGEIMIANIEGGDAPFTYEWSNSQFTESLDDLFPGEYTLTITDSNGCSTSASTSLAVDTLKVEVNVISDPSCNGISDGTVSFLATGGTPSNSGGYDYDIDGCSPTFYIGNGNDEVGPFIQSNFFEGCFQVVVTDDENCDSDPVKFCLIAGSFSTLTIDTVDVSCFGECNGSVFITAASVGNFSFQISDELGTPLTGISGPTTYQAVDVCPGTYNAIITNSNDGCVIDTTFTIGEPDLLETMVDSMGPGCGGGDGMMTLNPTGGTMPYDFEWNDGFMLNTRSNMVGGMYSVTIVDANGCRDSIMWTFGDGGDIGLSAGVLSAVTCESAADGSVRASVTAAGNYTFSWEDSNGLSLGDGDIINNLGGGIYYVTATDGMCTDIDSVIMAPGTTPSVTAAIEPPECLNTTNGMITAMILEGVAPLMFEWSQPPSVAIISSGPVLIGGIGEYNLHITDANGCEADTLLQITPPTNTIQIAITNQTSNPCFGSCGASATFTASGGPGMTGDYTFILNGSAMPSTAGAINANDLCAGSNYVLAFDTECSSDTIFFDVIDAAEIMIDVDASTINPPSCAGGNDGNISVTVIGGDDSDYGLLWLNEGIMGSDLSGLMAGEYVLQITDGIGCIMNDTINLETPDPLTVEVNTFTTIDISCFTDAVGAIDLLTSGGNPGELTFEWTPSVSTSSIAENLSPGFYSVTVTDVNGCEAMTSYELTSAPPIVPVIPTPDEPNCFGGTTCIAVESVTGGVGNTYTFSIQNGPNLPIDSCFTVFADTLLITVFDSAGCSIDTSVIIAQPSQVTVDVGDDIMINLGESSEPVSAFIVSELDIDSISWTPNVAIECNTVDCQIVTFSPTATTSYTVTVTDENGCLATDDITVVVDLARNVFTPNIFSPNSNNVNDHFQLAVGSGVTTVKYLKIFDRWGSLVHIEENYMPNDSQHIGWDGTRQGQELEAGVYVYFAEVEFIDGVSVVYKGDVTLVR